MSYPRSISALIVEDEISSKELYEQIFSAELPKDGYPIVERRFAFSHAQAAEELVSSRIFQLVILDLCIPEHNDQPSDSIDWGMRILDACIGRDQYPIPAILVITAFAGRTQQSDLRLRLRSSFSYGELIVKGGDIMHEIKTALDRVLSYLDIGIHIKDGAGTTWPTLSPREEDLLRRSVLEHNLSGVDISWWSSEYSKPTGSHAKSKGWTKVLMGCYLLPKGKGFSRVNFFKFAPEAGAEYVIQAAELLERKLNHIKISSSLKGGGRMLLVTEKTGVSNNPPVPLNKYLDKSKDEFVLQSQGIIKDVIEQLSALGDRRNEMRRPHELLWSFHNDELIRNMLQRYRRSHSADIVAEPPVTSPIEPFWDPLEVLHDIRASDHVVTVTQRECIHGDLNVTNVAIDLVNDMARAYIFDASGNDAPTALFDIAMLEVTALLHIPSELSYSLVEICGRILYGESVILPPTVIDDFEGPHRAANTLRLIAGLRAAVAGEGQEEMVYALAIFDQILLQIGGLQWSGNKISRFDDAVLLADLTAGWLRRVAAPLLTSGSGKSSQPPLQDVVNPISLLEDNERASVSGD